MICILDVVVVIHVVHVNVAVVVLCQAHGKTMVVVIVIVVLVIQCYLLVEAIVSNNHFLNLVIMVVEHGWVIGVVVFMFPGCQVQVVLLDLQREARVRMVVQKVGQVRDGVVIYQEEDVVEELIEIEGEDKCVVV